MKDAHTVGTRRSMASHWIDVIGVVREDAAQGRTPPGERGDGWGPLHEN